MMDTPDIQAKSSDRYTLAQLHQEIAKDEDWRTKFRYLPKVWKAGLKFYQITRQMPERQLLVGTHKTNEQARVHAQVYPSQSGMFNLVNIHLHDGTIIGLHQQQKEKEAALLQRIEYVEPFDRLDKAGSTNWRKSLRFLVLYYFLEQEIIDRSNFTRDGLKALKRACTSIASEPIRMQIKPTRPLLSLPRTNFTTTKPQAQLNARESERDDKRLSMKREPLPVVLVKAPENDSTRAVNTMVQQDDNIAAQLLQKPAVGEPEPEAKKETPIPANEPTRKRPASDIVTREEDPQEDPEIVFRRFKRLIRHKIENLEREEIAAQDTLNAQTMSLTETQHNVFSLEKALLAAKARLEAVQIAKAATEARLEEVRSEMAKNKTFEKDFDAFHA